MKWIRVSKRIVPKGFDGITLFPFIFLYSEDLKKNKVLVNHEKIHKRQQLELLFGLVFYLIYGIDYLIKYIKYQDKYLAYRNIIFEREAYANQYDLEYLKKRKWFAYWRKK